MPHSYGYRARTRSMFSRKFGEHGVNHLSTYLRNYKVRPSAVKLIDRLRTRMCMPVCEGLGGCGWAGGRESGRLYVIPPYPGRRPPHRYVPRPID